MSCSIGTCALEFTLPISSCVPFRKHCRPPLRSLRSPKWVTTTQSRSKGPNRQRLGSPPRSMTSQPKQQPLTSLNVTWSKQKFHPKRYFSQCHEHYTRSVFCMTFFHDWKPLRISPCVIQCLSFQIWYNIVTHVHFSDKIGRPVTVLRWNFTVALWTWSKIGMPLQNCNAYWKTSSSRFRSTQICLSFSFKMPIWSLQSALTCLIFSYQTNGGLATKYMPNKINIILCNSCLKTKARRHSLDTSHPH